MAAQFGVGRNPRRVSSTTRRIRDKTAGRSHVAHGGQRIGTLIMYLNDVEEGGETIFPEIGFSVAPRRGHAVYFGYCDSHGQVDPLRAK